MSDTIKKCLLIDCQLLQTTAWDRGMGKYLSQTMSKLQKSETFEVVAILNANLPTEATRIEKIKSNNPSIDYRIVDLPINQPGVKKETYLKELEEFISTEFKNTDNYYLISSLFTFDYFTEYPSSCKKMLLFYDLTPLMFWKDLGGYFEPSAYMGRFERIYEADIVLSISDTTKNDLVEMLGIQPSKVVNINGGYSQIAKTQEKPTHFDVPERYVLLPTGDLPHKNNELAIQGFVEFNQRHGGQFSLLISSNFNRESIDYLHLYSDKITFIGNVSDSELAWLYSHSEAVLFASKYEGLGIPILDAVKFEKPAVVSDIPVFKEISKDGFYYYKVDDYVGLANALDLALSEKYSNKLKDNTKLLEKYTWQNTANELFRSLGASSKSDVDTSATRSPCKLAIVTSHPGINDQIGRLSEPIWGNLKHKVGSVDFYFDSLGLSPQEIDRPSFLEYVGVHTYDIHSFKVRSYLKYDLVIYLIDEHSAFSEVTAAAVSLPGVVISSSIEKSSESISQLLLTIQLAGINISKLNRNQSTEVSISGIIDMLVSASIISRRNNFIKSYGSTKKLKQYLKERGDE